MPTKFSTAARTLFISIFYAALYAAVQFISAIVVGLVGIFLNPSGNLPLTFFNTVFDNIFLCTFAAMPAALVLYILLGFIRERHSHDELPLRVISTKTVVATIVAALGCRLAVCAYTELVVYVPALEESLENAPDYSSSFDTPLKIIFALAVLAVIGPVFEEILFRGFIQSELLRGFPPVVAIVLSSLIFSILHGLLFQSVFTFFVGLVLGWIAYRTRSLITSSILHIVFNSTSFVAAFIDLERTELVIAAASVAVIALAISCVVIHNENR